jgi:curved DNA-binding protein CbpA
MPVMKQDYYRIIEVDPTADPQAIGAAHKRMLQKFQPDATTQLAEINEAFEVLSDPAKRALYDYLRASRNSNRTSREAAARHRAEQEQARQRAERLQQRLRAWRQRASSDESATKQV